MATHKSAEKRARQAEVRRLRNRQVRSRVRTLVKTVRANAGSNVEALREAEGALRRAASQGVIPKRRASRLASRLARAAHAARA